MKKNLEECWADAAQNPETRFHSGHLEEFPELSDWLCVYFDAIYDANMGHNDLLELALNHLHNASLESQFFLSLSRTAPAVKMRVMGNARRQNF